MQSRRWLVLGVLGLFAVLAVVVVVLPRLETRGAPSFERAWVGIEVSGSGVAQVGTVVIEEGTPFRLHAILEAVGDDGRRSFYSEANQVQFGDNATPVSTRRDWNRGTQEIRALWFTVEGKQAYLELDAGERALDHLQFEAFSHPEWGPGWSVSAELDSRLEPHFDPDRLLGRRQFGTQRFQVWLELFRGIDSSLPEQRFKSAGPGEVTALGERFPTVVAEKAGALTPTTRVFGLTQIEVGSDERESSLAELATLYTQRLAYSRLLLLRDQIAHSGRSVADIRWQLVPIDGSVTWSSLAAGDLLQVGSRTVVLYSDFDEDGTLGPEDLCFDLEAGIAVRHLTDVFSGDGDVEWGPLRD